ncbi:MAG: metal ABC transporter solute-binding protein, Zn/Mn family [Enterocloster bolteae]
MIVVADKFPFRYFADEYGLSYRAAFSGCSGDTEPSARTIAYLIDKVKEDLDSGGLLPGAFQPQNRRKSSRRKQEQCPFFSIPATT